LFFVIDLVNTHSECINGASTIRAFDLISAYQMKNYGLVRDYMTAFYSRVSINRYLKDNNIH
jgi:hypothetical protein